MNARAGKNALSDRAEEFARSLFPAGKKHGTEWLVGSLGGEPGKSLSICIGGSKVGVFADFATGEKGDNLIELFSQAKRVEFKEALHTCAEWLGVRIDGHTPTAGSSSSVATVRETPTRALSPREVYDPREEECIAAVRMAETLSTDLVLCQRIANHRHWKPETLIELAREGYLGWKAGNGVGEGKIAFIYDTGVKLRWREKGERIIHWAFGKPWVWRGAWLEAARSVYLCESETDAISLIDAGVENEGGRHCGGDAIGQHLQGRLGLSVSWERRDSFFR